MNSFLRLSSILLRLLGKFINEVSLISEMKRENKMRVLNSSEAFKAKYVARVGSVADAMRAVSAGGAVASGATGASAIAAGAAAAKASVWSLGAGLPFIGELCAGKAAMVGTTAGVAALGSATVLLPALAVGGVVAYVCYRNRKKRSLHKGSRIEDVARAFAGVALLPMLALAVAECRKNSANLEPVRDYVLKEMGAWGYSESYVRSEFDKAMKCNPEELSSRYYDAIRQLESGSTEGIGATPAELPADVIRGFADKFCKDFRSNLA